MIMAVPGDDTSRNAENAALPKGESAGAPSVPGSTGAMLAAGRLKAGLELTDIARDTRVPLRHLRALEADIHDALPALPYAQGFVRAFARAVGLDPELMVARFRAETSKQPHVPSVSAMTALDERRLPKPGLVIVSLVALVALIGLLSAWGSGAFDPAPAAVAPEQTIETSAALTAPEAEAPLPAATQTASIDTQVTITAREQVWVRIYDPATQTVAMSGVMAAGERFEVPRDPPGLRLWTGRAGALMVTLGDRALPPLGGPAEVLRDVSLVPADLLSRPAPLAAAPPPPITGPVPVSE
jgi:cytoskeletal protein RodZ